MIICIFWFLSVEWKLVAFFSSENFHDYDASLGVDAITRFAVRHVAYNHGDHEEIDAEVEDDDF